MGNEGSENPLSRTMLFVALVLAQFCISFACVSYSTSRIAVANFGNIQASSSDVMGYVQFEQLGPNCTTTIKVALLNLPTDFAPYPYHIHVSPLAKTNVNCGLALGHFDPDGYEAVTPYVCNSTSPCSVGDLSGKHGKLSSGSQWVTFDDPAIQLFGDRSIIGRSVVIHKNTTTRYLCSTIALLGDLNVATVTAYLHGSNFAGNVTVQQLLSDSSSDSYVTVEGHSLDSSTPTAGHHWEVHEGAIPDWGSCPNTQGIWNPLNVSGSECSTSYSSHAQCMIGDLTGKLGTLTISGNETLNTTVHVDANLPLSGESSIKKKSIVIYGENGDSTAIGCGNFEEVSSCTKRGLVVQAQFPTGDPALQGNVVFSQAALGCPTTVSVSLTGTGIHNNLFHVHQYSSSVATLSGSHYDPFGREKDPNYAAQCAANSLMCSVGDLAGKYRTNLGSGLTASFVDYNLPLFGIYSIVGRSLVVHKPETKEVWFSTPITWESGTFENKFTEMYHLTTAFPATLDVQGTVSFGNVTGSGEAFVYGWVRHSFITDASNFQLLIHTNAATADCTNLGDVFDTVGISGTGCQNTQQSFCKAGDLSGKHAVFSLTSTNLTSFFFTDKNLNLASIQGKALAFHNATDGSVVACMNIDVAPTVSPSPLPASATPSPSASVMNYNKGSKKETSGQVAIITLVPMLLVLTAFGFYLWVTHSKPHNPNIGSYISPAGGSMWILSLLAFSLGVNAAKFKDGTVTPFDHSYSQILVGFNILAWLWITAALSYELVQKSVLTPMIMFGAEGTVALFSFCTSIAQMVFFDGEDDYCAYDSSNSNKCKVFQASIFFTWMLFFVTCCKIFLTLRRKSEAITNPSIRTKLSPIIDFEDGNDDASRSTGRTHIPVTMAVSQDPKLASFEAHDVDIPAPSAPTMDTDRNASSSGI